LAGQRRCAEIVYEHTVCAAGSMIVGEGKVRFPKMWFGNDKALRIRF